MTPQEFESAITKLKQLRGCDMNGEEGAQVIETIIDLGAEFIKANFIIADSVSRLAAAMEAQTKMLATVYNLDLQGQSAATASDDQGELGL